VQPPGDIARFGNPTALRANHFWRGNGEAVLTTGQKVPTIIVGHMPFVKQITGRSWVQSYGVGMAKSLKSAGVRPKGTGS
jgi:hypothetical protein